MNLDALMQEIAARAGGAPSLAGKTYAGPVSTVVPPAAIVPMPDKIGYDQTYARGRDVVDGWVVVVVGRPTEPQARQLATIYAAGAGAESIKVLLEAPGWVSCDSVDVTSAEFDAWDLAGVEYLAIVFTWRAFGPGNA